MARPQKWISEENKAIGWPSSLRKYWQEINRHERQKQQQQRTERKAKDEKRAKCRCGAYPWPHRPAGGLCRWPDAPVECWQRKPPKFSRPYGKRYAGLVRQIARNNGLHPIRDRETIQAFLAGYVLLAKQLKRQYPRVKYRNMLITQTGITGQFQTAGPMM